MKPLKTGVFCCARISGIYFKTLAKYDSVEVVACARLAPQIEEHLSDTKGRAIPMNIDGATAAIYTELGFKAPLARGPFCLSRSVGILATAGSRPNKAVGTKVRCLNVVFGRISAQIINDTNFTLVQTSTKCIFR
ncbi:citrate/2-methylcitrate synthase [Ruegeria sp. HKCCD8929]|uniref:citrate/2-methylcitrate synthase n=1 Tax=Ruegeria sp. HKCCD8929 TaxID=2683006 RepID=UPI001488D4B1